MNFRVIYLMATLLLLTVTGVSCAKKTLLTINKPSSAVITTIALPIDSVLNTLDTNCHVVEPIVAQANNWEGHVAYDGKAGLYSIVYVVPGSIDDRWVGYVCNMPDKFKRATLKVRFSGAYYHANQYVRVTEGGQNNLYLRLSSIRIASL